MTAMDALYRARLAWEATQPQLAIPGVLDDAPLTAHSQPRTGSIVEPVGELDEPQESGNVARIMLPEGATGLASPVGVLRFVEPATMPPDTSPGGGLTVGAEPSRATYRATGVYPSTAAPVGAGASAPLTTTRGTGARLPSLRARPQHKGA